MYHYNASSFPRFCYSEDNLAVADPITPMLLWVRSVRVFLKDIRAMRMSHFHFQYSYEYVPYCTNKWPKKPLSSTDDRSRLIDSKKISPMNKISITTTNNNNKTVTTVITLHLLNNSMVTRTERSIFISRLQWKGFFKRESKLPKPNSTRRDLTC